MREIREREGFSLQSLADSLGVTKSRLAAYESGRNPVRYDIALRFCRRMIVNEEWLATGRLDLIRAALKKRGFSKAVASSHSVQEILKSMAMDLGAESESRSVPAESTIEQAFSKHLRKPYERLAAIHTHFPRIAFTENDTPEYFGYFMGRMLRIWMEQIFHIAGSEGIDAGLARRSFVRACLETNHVIFKRFILLETPEIQESTFDFLRAIANDYQVGIGPMSIARQEGEFASMLPEQSR